MQSESYAIVIKNKTVAYPIFSVNTLAKEEDVTVMEGIVPARLEHVRVVKAADKIWTGQEGPMH